MKQKFTFQIRGNVLIDNQAELETQMREILAGFPNFAPTFTSIEVWQDINGYPRIFNDDGTDYKEPSQVLTEEASKDVEPEDAILEEVTL